MGLDNKAFIEGLKASKALAVETTTEIEKMMKLDSSRVSNKNTQLLKQQKIEAEINLTNEKALAAKIAGEARLTESIARRAAIEVESTAKLQLLNEQKAAVQLITDARLSESFARRAATEAASQAASQMSAEKRAAFLLESESKLDALFEKRVAAEKKALTDLQNSINKAASERALNEAKRIEAIKKANAFEITAIAEVERKRAATASMIANDEEKRRLSIQKRMDMERRLAITNEKHAAFMAKQNVTASAQAASFTRILQGQLPILSQLKTMAGTYLSIWMAVRFIKNLATISGEFELQRKSLEAILQDSVAAAKIFTQIKQLAVESPFQFKDMVSYAKQLSAFSIPIDELYDTTKRLADISAGLGVDMGRIILAYGQVRSASVLRGYFLAPHSGNVMLNTPLTAGNSLMGTISNEAIAA